MDDVATVACNGRLHLHINAYFGSLQLYTFNLREDFYREDPGAESPQPMFGQVAGTDRDIGENAKIYFHALGDSKSCRIKFDVRHTLIHIL